MVFPADTDCDCFRNPAHRAFCARAIFRREAADMIRFGSLVSPVFPEPFKDSIPEIIWSNFSSSICVRLRFSRSSRRALSKLDIVSPSGFSQRVNCIGGESQENAYPKSGFKPLSKIQTKDLTDRTGVTGDIITPPLHSTNREKPIGWCHGFYNRDRATIT